MYRNNEGYADPTAGIAMAGMIYEYRQNRKKEKERIEKIKNRKWVYVVSKYAGDTKTNVDNAKKYCRFAVKKNCIPIASHLLYPSFMDDNNPEERELGLLFGQALLAKCSEVWVFGTDYGEGMKAEIHEAKKLKKTIKYFNEGMQRIK